MIMLSVVSRLLALAAGVFSIAFALAPNASADIVKIQDATSCNTTSLSMGGNICNGTIGTPFLLSGIENGSVVLTTAIPGAAVFTYLIEDNTGATSFTLNFSGVSLGMTSGIFVNCQESGGFAGDTCTITGASGTGSGTSTFVPSIGTDATFSINFSLAGIPTSGSNADLFDLTFPSWSNGATGTTTGPGPSPVPEPSSLALLGIGLVGFASLAAWRKKAHLV